MKINLRPVKKVIWSLSILFIRFKSLWRADGMIRHKKQSIFILFILLMLCKPICTVFYYMYFYFVWIDICFSNFIVNHQYNYSYSCRNYFSYRFVGGQHFSTFHILKQKHFLAIIILGSQLQILLGLLTRMMQFYSLEDEHNGRI